MLTIKNLTVTVQEKTLLSSLTLTIKPGEIHALLGPNGSGKTSLSLALAGHPSYQISPQSKIILNQQSLISLSPDQRAQAGLLLAFQSPITIPGVSIQNFLKSAFTAMHPHNQDFPTVLSFRHHLQQLAHSLNLKPEHLTRAVNDGFSGGEKKRLELLQLLLLKPKIAIFDETDSGLDIDSINLVVKTIHTLQSKYHAGIIVISHYKELFAQIHPQFVHVISKGKLIQSGDEQLINSIHQYGFKSL